MLMMRYNEDIPQYFQRVEIYRRLAQFRQITYEPSLCLILLSSCGKQDLWEIVFMEVGLNFVTINLQLMEEE